MQLNKYIEHTNLNNKATLKDIESLFTVSDDSGNYTFKIIENN